MLLQNRLTLIIDKARKRGFHQATNKQLLDEATSATHLRSLIGWYQDNIKNND